MSIIQKYSARGALLALASLIAGVVLASPTFVHAAYDQLSYTLTASTTNSNYYTFAINEEPVRTQSASTRIYTGYFKSPMYDVAVSDITIYSCPGGFSSSGAAPATPFITNRTLNISTVFIADPVGGSDTADCNTTGTYYMLFTTYAPSNSYTDCSTKTCWYIPVNYNAETNEITTQDQFDIESFNATTQTRFTNISVTGSTTVNIEAEYFLEQTEIDVTKSETNPAMVRFQYSLRPGTTFDGFSETIDATIQGTSTVDIDLASFADGTYDLLVTFSNSGCSLGLSLCPFKDSYVYSSFTIASGTLTAVGDLEYYDGTQPPLENRYQDCTITNIGNCISNAFVYLFFPSQTSLNSFTILGDQLDTRFPFAYVFDTFDLIQLLFNTTQNQSLALEVPFASYGDITLISEQMLEDIPMSATIKTLLTYALYIMFMLQMYNRTRNIFSTTQTT